MATRIGTDVGETLNTPVGNTTDDFVVGMGGDDSVQTYDGSDEIHGGWGDDALLGGLGDDWIFGFGSYFGRYSAGVDDNVWPALETDDRNMDQYLDADDNPSLETEPDDDLVTGGAGNDFIYGGWGNDRLYGSNSAMSIGSGRDTIYGGPGDDFIYGGDSDDVLGGGAGNDKVQGNEGNDTFRFYGGDNSHLEIGGIPRDFHDEYDGGAGLNTVDLRRAPGVSVFYVDDASQIDPSGQYNYVYNVQTFIGEEIAGNTLYIQGDNKTNAITVDFTKKDGDSSFIYTNATLTHQSAAGTTTLALNRISQVVFVNDGKKDGGIVNDVSSALSNGVAFEMLRLADEVYGPQSTLDNRHYEALAYESAHAPATSENISDNAQSRHWHAVSALELGLMPADYGAGAIKYSFVDGVYQAIHREDTLGNEANAMVLTGLVNGKPTLVVTFRGTDEYSDFTDYVDFADHYLKFAPLVEAIKAYLEENTGIKNVLVSGHSLGGATASLFVHDLASMNLHVDLYTDGSPGAHGPTEPALNLVNTDDPVATDASLVKGRTGSDIIINSDVLNHFINVPLLTTILTRDFSEHAANLYTVELLKLRSWAVNSDPNTLFRSSAFAQSLLNNTVYNGPDIQISLGRPATLPDDSHARVYDASRYASPFTATMVADYDDDFVLGNNGIDDVISMSIDLLGHSETKIEGGTGTDRLIFTNRISSLYDISYNSLTDITHIDSKIFPSLNVQMTAHSVELLVFLDGAFKSNGSAANVQTPSTTSTDSKSALAFIAASKPVFTLKEGFDYADAGDGDTEVQGTEKADILYVGNGNKSVFMNGGDDIVVVKGTSAANTITIDGGTGADTFIGGIGNETYIVDNLGDAVLIAEDAGYHKVVSTVDFAMRDNVDDLDLIAGSKGAGNALANVITGNAGANLLSGLEGADTLSGGDGDDILQGGKGNDTAHGGAGNDTAIFTGNFADYHFAQAGTAISVADQRADAPDGTDIIDGVETLRFADGDVAVSSLVFSPGNHPPVLTGTPPPLAAGSEDTAYTLTRAALLSGYTDADGDALALSGVTATHGAITGNPDGSYTFLPDADFNGQVSLSFTVSDGHGGTLAGVRTLTIAAINDAPSAAIDAYGTNEDMPLSVAAGAGLLSNDNDIEGDALAPTLVNAPAHGNLTLAADGSFVYTPAANYAGDDVFSYRASDGVTLSAITTVTIHVAPVNDAPDAGADNGFSTPYQTALQTAAAALLANDGDIDGDPLSVVSVQGAVNGAVSLAGGIITFTPSSGYEGAASYTYTVSDGHGGSDTTTVSLTVHAAPPVEPDNTGPVAIGDAYALDEDGQLMVPAGGVLGNDSDLEGDPLSAALVSGPSHGALTLNGDGSFIYTPQADYNGSDSFTYRASDGALESAETVVSLTVRAVNDAPAAANDTATTRQDAALVLAAASLLGNDGDIDGDSLVVTGVSAASHGTVSLAGSSITFTPASGYSGAASFGYDVSDGHGGTAHATVNISVTPVAPQPPAERIYFRLDGNTSGSDFSAFTHNVLALGGSSDDTITGSDFDDSLNGGRGDDVLAGGEGRDKLTGGPGTDRLRGDGGNDTFIFRAGDLSADITSADHVDDFHGAGGFIGSRASEDDLLQFYGFSAGSTLVLDHVDAANPAVHYYWINDPSNSLNCGYVIIEMVGGSAPLTAGDYRFF